MKSATDDEPGLHDDIWQWLWISCASTRHDGAVTKPSPSSRVLVAHRRPDFDILTLRWRASPRTQGKDWIERLQVCSTVASSV